MTELASSKSSSQGQLKAVSGSNPDLTDRVQEAQSSNLCTRTNPHLVGTMYHSFPMLYKDLYSKSFFSIQEDIMISKSLLPDIEIAL